MTCTRTHALRALSSTEKNTEHADVRVYAFADLLAPSPFLPVPAAQVNAPVLLHEHHNVLDRRERARADDGGSDRSGHRKSDTARHHFLRGKETKVG